MDVLLYFPNPASPAPYPDTGPESRSGGGEGSAVPSGPALDSGFRRNDDTGRPCHSMSNRSFDTACFTESAGNEVFSPILPRAP